MDRYLPKESVLGGSFQFKKRQALGQLASDSPGCIWLCNLTWMHSDLMTWNKNQKISKVADGRDPDNS